MNSLPQQAYSSLRAWQYGVYRGSAHSDQLHQHPVPADMIVSSRRCAMPRNLIVQPSRGLRGVKCAPRRNGQLEKPEIKSETALPLLVGCRDGGTLVRSTQLAVQSCTVLEQHLIGMLQDASAVRAVMGCAGVCTYLTFSRGKCCIFSDTARLG